MSPWGPLKLILWPLCTINSRMNIMSGMSPYLLEPFRRFRLFQVLKFKLGVPVPKEMTLAFGVPVW